ncbi:TPA: hypothetical protein QC285_004304 [Bacillus cereus]|uniref:hypothetical protein n=1 Tax=Bacillus cereus group TaxID=86661 RepID=UPI001596DF99|nr:MULTISPECIES: hypothetical protein [Bacillus cereus group]HDR8342853.1 hypothetical protein [Bacillus cereus]HDR8353643.1 hypothetical protein [Bacillus cereus]HDR8358685.1 hypothetical protein [Bacillus cereus]HDR8382503.1 hypothetical protein [Bacillus cereus]HDR8434487.1 hypothetical protein [Bacillus cereus]
MNYYSLSQKKELDNVYVMAKKLLIQIKEQNNNQPLKETHFFYLSQAIEYWELQNKNHV